LSEQVSDTVLKIERTLNIGAQVQVKLATNKLDEEIQRCDEKIKAKKEVISILQRTVEKREKTEDATLSTKKTELKSHQSALEEMQEEKVDLLVAKFKLQSPTYQTIASKLRKETEVNTSLKNEHQETMTKQSELQHKIQQKELEEEWEEEDYPKIPESLEELKSKLQTVEEKLKGFQQREEKMNATIKKLRTQLDSLDSGFRREANKIVYKSDSPEV